jgi:hypothetical protein
MLVLVLLTLLMWWNEFVKVPCALCHVKHVRRKACCRCSHSCKNSQIDCKSWRMLGANSSV